MLPALLQPMGAFVFHFYFSLPNQMASDNGDSSTWLCLFISQLSSESSEPWGWGTGRGTSSPKAKWEMLPQTPIRAPCQPLLPAVSLKPRQGWEEGSAGQTLPQGPWRLLAHQPSASHSLGDVWVNKQGFWQTLSLAGRQAFSSAHTCREAERQRVQALRQMCFHLI